MAVIGFTALILIFVAVASDFVFGCGVVFLAVGAVSTVILLVTKEFKNYTVIAYICAAMIFSGVLLMSNSVFGRDEALKYADTECDVTAVVTDDMSVYNNSNAYVLKTDSINNDRIRTKILVYSKTSFPYKPGDKICFHAKITDNLIKRDFVSRLSYIADEEYLYSFLTDASSLTLKENGNKTIQRYLYLIRNGIKLRIYSFLPGEEGAVTVGMLTGDKSGISSETKNSFSRSGISHLFAVSGLHLSVWVMSLYMILKKLIRRRRISEILSVAFTVFFMALTGFTASVCRAGLMLIIVLLAKIFDEDSDSLNSLGLSAFIILAVNPMAAVSLSLLLSFSATLGIITAYPVLERKIFGLTYYIKNKTARRFYKYVLNLAAVSVCATLFTLPVSAFFIGSISLFAPVTNILVSFAATAQMIFGGLSAILYSLLFIARPCAFFCGILSKYVIFVSSFISDIPFSSVETDSVYFRISLIVIISFVLCVFLLTDNSKKRLIGAVAGVVCISLISSSLFILFNYGETTVTVFNTGGGVSVQIKHDGYTMLVGCGGKENYPEEYMTSVLEENTDLLLIPDRSQNSSSMLMYYIDYCNPQRVISGENNYSIKQMCPQYEVYNNFTLKPWRGASLVFYNDGEDTYMYLDTEQGGMLMIFRCVGYDSIPENYFGADVQISYSDEHQYVKNNKNVFDLSCCDSIEFNLDKNNTEFICNKG